MALWGATLPWCCTDAPQRPRAGLCNCVSWAAYHAGLLKAHVYKYPTAIWQILQCQGAVIQRMTPDGDLATVTQACVSLCRGNDPRAARTSCPGTGRAAVRQHFLLTLSDQRINSLETDYIEDRVSSKSQGVLKEFIHKIIKFFI